MACHKDCAPKACIDLEGCAECNSGYFLSMPFDKNVAATCLRCADSIPGCMKCVSAVKDGEEQCLECMPGFMLVDGFCVDFANIAPAMGSIGAYDVEEGLVSELDLDISQFEYEDYEFVTTKSKGSK